MKLGSLFAGIGGFDLAARWMGWETAWFSEIEPYAGRVLAKNFPGVPNHGDVTKIKGADVAPVDMLVGGFPCQDISLCGNGAGINGARSGLWRHYARLIEETRPRWVVTENVAALRSRGLGRVLQDLASFGYHAEWHCIPASAVGAPHRRDRIWIVAHSDTHGERLHGVAEHNRAPEGSNPGVQVPAVVRACHIPGVDSNGLRDGVPERGGAPGAAYARAAQEWFAVEPGLGRVAYGVPARVDRLRCLGNSIVPYVAFQVFKAIDAWERSL